MIFIAGLALGSMAQQPAAKAIQQSRATASINAPVLKWQRGGCFASWCQTGWYASPAVADLDGDGRAEVLWASYDLVALDGATGVLKWRAASNQRAWPGIAVADLTGDGTLEVIVGRSGDQVTVYNKAGGVVWTRNPFGNGEVRTLAVADLDNDGKQEIIAGRASGGSTKQLNVFQADGTVRPGWPARRDGEAGYGWGMYNENVAVADVTGDGFKDVIGPTDTHYITALDRNGNQLPANAQYNNFNPRGAKVWSQVGVHVDNAVDLRGYANCGIEHRPNFADSAPAIADLDGDGTREIIVVGNVYNCDTDPYTSLYRMAFVLRGDRSRWAGSGFDWTTLPVQSAGSAPLSEDYNVIESSVANAVVADLDGDGKKEILFPSYDGRLHVYSLDKTQRGAWPFKAPGAGIRFISEPAVADLNGDGKAEVIVTTWPQKGGAAVGQLIILDALGNLRQAVDLPASFPAGGVNGGLAAPTLANIDDDADLEAVIGTISSGAVAYDLPNTANARVLWGTGRGSFARTGTPAEPSCFKLALAVSPVGAGEVIAAPSPNCSTGYTPGTVVTLTATANLSNTLIAWNGIGGVLRNPITTTLNADRSVTAAFLTFVPKVNVYAPAVMR
jgi:hypothetical protein